MKKIIEVERFEKVFFALVVSVGLFGSVGGTMYLLDTSRYPLISFLLMIGMVVCVYKFNESKKKEE